MSELRDSTIVDQPETALERALMEEYLSDEGYTFDDVASFDDEERERMLVEAAAYAALRLAELAYS